MAIERLVGRDAFIEKRSMMANVVVAQFLPNGSVKGGSAIKMRLGDETTRYTTDLDVARAESIQDFKSKLSLALDSGWEGFTGSLVDGRQAHPANVPTQYIMQPYQVKLSYNGKPWITVALEVGHDEIGDADDPDWIVPEDVAELFAQLGFPSPRPIAVMALHHQIAQKIHAATEFNSQRAHDIVDLQLIATRSDIDYLKTCKTCERLFAYRRMQEWPPVVTTNEGWESIYAEAADGLDVLSDVNEAVVWANEFIQRIERSRYQSG